MFVTQVARDLPDIVGSIWFGRLGCGSTSLIAICGALVVANSLAAELFWPCAGKKPSRIIANMSHRAGINFFIANLLRAIDSGSNGIPQNGEYFRTCP